MLDVGGEGGEERKDKGGSRGGSHEEMVEEAEGGDRLTPGTRGEGEGSAIDANDVVVHHH